ncbi:MAG TPA: type II secretion system F family protein [Nocardioides sp.]|uniref:type II secretion system F family protein n=1 Tax=Nocardioides sp. TaxID=35761 RepID=UPI002C5F61D1|nr:type II secretion system F family protein [Nocardioides sp.]HTW18489.1 type II secretion system F family protein [Nocardioides sp.]
MWLLLVMAAGALVGAGLLLAGMLVAQPRTSGPVALAQLDARLARGRRQATVTADRRHQAESARMRKFGAEISDSLDNRGIRLPRSLRASLAMVGQSREMFLAQTVLCGLLGLVMPALLLGALSALGLLGVTIPFWLSVIGAVLGAAAPYLQVSSQATERRRGFRHVVSSFLDLVAMNLAGGRGVPEALQAASHISDGWAMVRIRDALEAARLQGRTPWAALGDLGEEVDVDELRDLSAALALVAEDGAKVRDSLTARAASMRRKELADAEGRAAARSQSMLVAQLLLCVGFLVFLGYPAVAQILG